MIIIFFIFEVGPSKPSHKHKGDYWQPWGCSESPALGVIVENIPQAPLTWKCCQFRTTIFHHQPAPATPLLCLQEQNQETWSAGQSRLPSAPAEFLETEHRETAMV